MREIKFRAWDELNEHMVSYDRYGEAEDFWMMTRKNEWPVMQYIGLKDKNEKEIYEGDILRQPHNSDFKFLYHLIEWSNKNCTWRARHRRDSSSDAVGEGSCLLFVYLANTLELEVIGNIYENPELLKEQENEQS